MIEAERHVDYPLHVVWLDKFFGYERSTMPACPTMLTIGGYTRERLDMWRAQYPSSPVYSYEACLAAHEHELAERVGEHEQVRYGALAGTTGTVTLYKSNVETSHSILGMGDMKDAVYSLSIRDMLNEIGGKCDLLYMNCEGAEIFALTTILADATLIDAFPQICVSFHSQHVSFYPPQVTGGIIAAMAEHYAVIPGRRAQQYFLFVKQPRM